MNLGHPLFNVHFFKTSPMRSDYDMEEYFVESGKLQELRKTLDRLPDLADHLGRPINMSLVVDTNVIIQDIRWLVHVRKNPTAQSGLQEIIAAGTVELNAPTVLIDEVELHLPRIAAQENINLPDMLAEWEIYKGKIKFFKLTEDMLYEPEMGDDKKDIPFVVLQDLLGSNGILSDDTDISRMSNKAVAVDVVLSLRDYSRASAIDFHIRVNGYHMAALSFGALEAAFRGIGTLIMAIKNAPPAVHWFLGIAGAATLINPNWRKKVFSYLKDTLGVSEDLILLLLEAIEKGTMTAQHHREIAQRKLDELPPHVKTDLKITPID